MRRETRPWTCPKCGKHMKEGGKGPHGVVCGKDPSPRFWGWIRKGAPNECWPWLGGVRRDGYPQCAVNHKNVSAHRRAYELAVGPIPAGLHMMHSCDNRICCNPAHLRPGTRLENMRDCIAKGRRGTRYQPVETLLHPQLSKRGKMSKSTR